MRLSGWNCKVLSERDSWGRVWLFLDFGWWQRIGICAWCSFVVDGRPEMGYMVFPRLFQWSWHTAMPARRIEAVPPSSILVSVIASLMVSTMIMREGIGVSSGYRNYLQHHLTAITMLIHSEHNIMFLLGDRSLSSRSARISSGELLFYLQNIGKINTYINGKGAPWFQESFTLLGKTPMVVLI